MEDLRRISEIALGMKMTDAQFNLAKAQAEKKQKRIYSQTKRPQVLDIFYLGQLVKEAAIEQAFMQACR